MNTADLIISIVFVCINSTALFLIYRAISRWMTRNEKKIDNLEHAILKIDDYIKYSSHTIDTVYIYALNRLIEQYIKDEKYEVADHVKKDLQLVQANVLKEMKRRMEEAEKNPMKTLLIKNIIRRKEKRKKSDF